MLHARASEARSDGAAHGRATPAAGVTRDMAPPQAGNQGLTRMRPRRPAAMRPSCMIQRQCSCDGTCEICKAKDKLQAKSAISEPGDEFEREADAVADQVMRMPASSSDATMAAGVQGHASASVPEGVPSIVGDVLRSSGQPLDRATRAFMEPRLGRDFSSVRVHTDGKAAESAEAIHARAYTLGSDVVFASGAYAPRSPAGLRLLAHELTHVAQQRDGSQGAIIQRDCDDPNFCKAYDTKAEAAAAEADLRSSYLPKDRTVFGANSAKLFESYLDRHPGDSLAPVIFKDPASDVVDSFATSGATKDDQDAIIDLIGKRLDKVPAPLKENVPTTMSIENFVTRAEMDFRDINYSNPFSVAGHIAGGIGSSDAGQDYRKIEWGNVTLVKTPLIGSTGYVSVETTLHYEVFDAIDFCPGDCGSPAEQWITVPMSRLEASGEAYDVPFKVLFVPESRSKRFFYS